MGYGHGHPVRLVGGRLALDFTNTADWSEDGKVVHEKVETLADLRIWADRVGLAALELPPELGGIHALRAELRRDVLELLAAVSSGRFVPRLRPAMGRDASPFERAIAAAAAGLFLDRNEARRIKRCPADDCGWLFLDETGNGRRRWCAMETCGNRAKARRHHRRIRAMEH